MILVFGRLEYPIWILFTTYILFIFATFIKKEKSSFQDKVWRMAIALSSEFAIHEITLIWISGYSLMWRCKDDENYWRSFFFYESWNSAVHFKRQSGDVESQVMLSNCLKFRDKDSQCALLFPLNILYIAESIWMSLDLVHHGDFPDKNQDRPIRSILLHASFPCAKRECYLLSLMFLWNILLRSRPSWTVELSSE